MKTKEQLIECDAKADCAIKVMMAAVAAAAIIPAHVNWAATAAAMGVGCAAIGKAYGFNLSKGEGWMLAKQFLIGAGTYFLAMNVGVKIFAALAETVGFGYVIGAAIDAAFCSAAAWAIGGCARSYFRNMAQGNQQLPSEYKRQFQEMYAAFRRGEVDLGGK